MTAKKVIAVAGGDSPGNVREVPPDDEDAGGEESWQDRPTLVPIVELLKRQMAVELQRLTDSQECFGCWLEDGEECPETECDLATYCQQAWNMERVEAGRSAKPEPKPAPTVVPPAPPLETAIESEFAKGDSKARAALRAKESAKRTERHKYAGQEKYSRKGYQNLGRNSDKCVAAFVKALGNPRRLPKVWNREGAKEALEKSDELVISATKSYHAVMWQGTVVARFWTNASKAAIIDLVTELVPPVKGFIATVSWGADEKPPITPPAKCPANSWMKLRPCTYRVTVRTPTAAKGVATAIKAKYGICAE